MCGAHNQASRRMVTNTVERDAKGFACLFNSGNPSCLVVRMEFGFPSVDTKGNVMGVEAYRLRVVVN